MTTPLSVIVTTLADGASTVVASADSVVGIVTDFTLDPCAFMTVVEAVGNELETEPPEHVCGNTESYETSSPS